MDKEQLSIILAKVARIASLVRPDTAEDQEARETMVLLQKLVDAETPPVAAPPAPPPAVVTAEQFDAGLAAIREQIADLAHAVMAPAPEAPPATEGETAPTP